jgi:D-xylose 1-dehydrogenase (NADP+, D-xylono-1,5-lactone-forming)
MSDRIRWGILGNATIARTCVIPAIQKSRNSMVRALGTRFPAAAAEAAHKNAVVNIYDSYDAVLSDPLVDAVYIPLPNHLHLPWALKSFRAGKHVLCEKPLACNADEARVMAEAAADAGLLLMEGFMYRFHPRSRKIKQLVADGFIGTPCLVHSAFCYHIGEELLSSGNNYRLRPDEGGGALLDVGCYSVSLARWLFSAEPAQVHAQAVYHPGGADVHIAGTLRFPGSELASFEASFTSALQQTFTIAGSQGAVELPHDAFIPWENDALFSVRERSQEKGEDYVIPGADEYQLMVEHFSDAIQGNALIEFPAEDSVRNLRVLDALAKAARTGCSVMPSYP